MGNSQSHTSEPFIVNGVEVYATFEDDWFGEGASRYAYRGRIKPVSIGWFKRGEQCVVKLYKEEYSARLKEDAWKADNRASLKAQEMAAVFNIKYNGKSSARVEVLIPIISHVKTFAAHKQPEGDPVPKTIRGTHTGRTAKADVMVREGASVAIERLLQGQYVHFLSNSAYVNPSVDTVVPVAFSHFTYHKSKGEILVTDLQGVHNQNSYIFTDPAIHSTEKHGKKFGYYGPTDLGVFGVIKFFLDHKCNCLCKGLLTPDTSGIPSDVREDLFLAIEAIKARSSTSFTYQLVVNSGLTAEKLQNLHTKIAQALTKSGSTIPELNGTRVHISGLKRTMGAQSFPTTMQKEAQIPAASAATDPETAVSNKRPGRVDAQPSLPEYRMNRNPRGLCMIINNVKFKRPLTPRPGS